MEARAAILQSVEKLRAVSSMRGKADKMKRRSDYPTGNEGRTARRGKWRATAEEWQRKDGEKVVFSTVERFSVPN